MATASRKLTLVASPSRPVPTSLIQTIPCCPHLHHRRYRHCHRHCHSEHDYHEQVGKFMSCSRHSYRQSLCSYNLVVNIVRPFSTKTHSDGYDPITSRNSNSSQNSNKESIQVTTNDQSEEYHRKQCESIIQTPPQQRLDAQTLNAATSSLRFWASHVHLLRRGHDNDNCRSNSSEEQQKIADLILSLFARLSLEEEKPSKSNDGSHHDPTILHGKLYAYAIDALAGLGIASDAERLLRRMVHHHLHLHLTNGNNNGRESSFDNNHTKEFDAPHAALFGATIRAHAKSESTSVNFNSNSISSGAERAEALLRYQIQLYRQYYPSLSFLKPTAMSFVSLIDAYARRGDGLHAEAILKEMLQFRFHSNSDADHDDDNGDSKHENDDEKNGLEVTVHCWNAVLVAWARASARLGQHPKRTRQYVPAHSHGHPHRSAIDPSTATGDTTAEDQYVDQMTLPARNAERILLDMIQSSSIVAPDTISYSSVISAWANCPIQPMGARNAEKILQSMEHMANNPFPLEQHHHNNTTTLVIEPNTICYNTVIDAYGKIGDAVRAEQILRRLLHAHEHELYRDVRPDTATFNTVLKAWAESKRHDAGRRAQNILNVMEGMGGDDDDNEALSTSTSTSTAAFLRPDLVTYNTVLNAWSKCTATDAAFMAEQLLGRMEEIQNKSRKNTLDVVSYNTVIAAWGRHNDTIRRRRQTTKPLPNTQNDNGSKHFKPSSGRDIAERAETLLKRMERAGVKPDVISFNGCISAWAKSGAGWDAAKRSELLLEQMEQIANSDPDVAPTCVTYSAVMDAYAKSGARNAGSLAESVLRRMELRYRQSKDGKIVPNIVAFNSVINAYAKGKEPDAIHEAESILAILEENAKMEDDRQDAFLPHPDLITYCSVIDVHSKSLLHDKASRASNVLIRMMSTISPGFDESNFHHGTFDWTEFRGRQHRRDMNIVRNAHNMLIRTCAFTPNGATEKEKRHAMKIAIMALRNLQSSNQVCSPNHATYDSLLQGCANVLGKGSKQCDALALGIFRECCNEGLVNEMIWNRFLGAVSPMVKRDAALDAGLGDGHELTYDSIPTEWKRTGAT